MTRPLRLPPFPLQSPTTGFAYSSILELSLARGSGCRRALEVISVCRIPILVPPQAVTQYIRRGRGLTFAKLAECQHVMEVLGDLPLRVAYERLAGMVRMLGEDVQAMALRNAYAIDMPAPDTLTRRRERIAGIHRLSIDTIELYERNMIDELALRLVHRELPVGS
jgi:hypothetical protein